LHSKDGFSVRNQQPDFVFTKDDKTYCVEVELSKKSKTRLERKIISYFRDYDIQIWIVGENTQKLSSMIEEFKISYPNIIITNLKTVGNMSIEK